MRGSPQVWLALGCALISVGCGRTQVYQLQVDAGAPCALGDIVECTTDQPGVCAPGRSSCIVSNGALKPGPCVATVMPTAEICDELDNDCDGQVDEGLRCPHAPKVTCGAAQTVDANTIAHLDSSASDIDGDTFNCQWTVVSRPTTSSSTFTQPFNCDGTDYFADIVGTHQLRFTSTDSTGRSSSCETTLTVLPVGDLWIELTWDRDNDVDLHLQHPNAGNPLDSSSWAQRAGNNDCYWDNKGPEWDTADFDDNPSLDRDDELNTGPENIRINTPTVGQSYRVGVHMFRSRDGFPVVATVRVYCAQKLVTELVRNITSVGEMWFAGSVVHKGASCDFTVDGRTLYVEPVE